MLNKSSSPDPTEIAARCHEIQTGLGLAEVPDFENLRKIGMAVRLSLHIRGLPPVSYDTLRLVATHYLGIPAVAVRSIVELLAEVEFVKIVTEGKTLKAVVANVPYYENLYSQLGTFANDGGFNEAEQLSIDLLCRLSKAPEKVDALRTTLGADKALFSRALVLGNEGAYVRVHRSRGRDVALSPTFFSENAELYADIVAKSNSTQVKKILTALRAVQGMPMSVIQESKEIGGVQFSDDELSFMLMLAQDGAVKPPSIQTSYKGQQYFLFTPTPAGAALAPSKRDIYERAMAVVAAVRQGQFLPEKIRIRSPGAVLYTLKTSLQLSKATTEATQQYRQLVLLRVAQLVDAGNGYSQLKIIDTPENREALSMAYALVDQGVAQGTEVDDSAREALQRDQTYIESLIASGELQRRRPVQLTQEQQIELDHLFLR